MSVGRRYKIILELEQKRITGKRNERYFYIGKNILKARKKNIKNGL